jgi:transposase-like protein
VSVEDGQHSEKEGSKMKGRTWTADEKLAIVWEGIKGAKPVAEICREHQIAQPQDYQWRDRFLEGGKRALTNGISASEEALKREIEKLQRLIGKQAVAIELLKKTDELVGRR